jgi:hypothetical protein
MEKSKNLDDRKHELVVEEIKHVEKLIKGHEKILNAIGEL